MWDMLEELRMGGDIGGLWRGFGGGSRLWKDDGSRLLLEVIGLAGIDVWLLRELMGACGV